jgi:hypothetical protein
MFKDSRFNGDIRNWDVSNVISMNYTFEGSVIYAKDFDEYNKKQEPYRNIGIFMDILEL